MSVSDQIRTFWLTSGLTQQQIADRLVCSKSVVTAVCTRGKRPSLLFVQRFDACYGTDLLSELKDERRADDMRRRNLLAATGVGLAAVLAPEVAQASTTDTDLVNTLGTHLAQTESLKGSVGLERAGSETVRAAWTLLRSDASPTALETAAYAVNRAAKVAYGTDRDQGLRLYRSAAEIASQADTSIRAYCWTDYASALYRAGSEGEGLNTLASVDISEAHPLVQSYHRYVTGRTQSEELPDLPEFLDETATLHAAQNGPWWALQLWGGGEGQIHSSKASVLLSAKRYDLAVDELQSAVDLLGPDRTRDKAICARRLVEVWERLGEPDRAAEAAPLASELNSYVKDRRVDDLESKVSTWLPVVV
jgi:tetratricopeptide (TPR) repeat protein